MCNLYSLCKAPKETQLLFNFVENHDFPQRPIITPGSPIAIIRGFPTRHFVLVRWGLVPSWKKAVEGQPLTQARAETIVEKPSFKHAIKRRRCLIPADGFYEWGGEELGPKQCYFAAQAHSALFAFAGIWEHWQGADGSELESAALITCPANKDLSPINDRMPVIIHRPDFDLWLNVADTPLAAVLSLLKPSEDGTFALTPVNLPGRSSPMPKPKAQLDLF